MLKQRMIEAIKARAPEKAKGVDFDTITDEALFKLYEALPPAAGTPPGTEPTREATPAAGGQATGAADAEPVTRAELRMVEARAHARTAVAASGLPQAAKDRLTERFAKMERFTEAEADAEIKAEREYVARFVESGRPNGGMGRIEVGDTVANFREALDAFFDPGHKHHRQHHSFKELYVAMTGDRMVTGQADRQRLTESIGTDTFPQALGDSITRRLQAAYTEAVVWSAWRRVCSVAPVADFRLQSRTAVGGFGNLPIVAQRGPYTELANPSDDEATYSVAKRGGLAVVTMEAIKNDDVGAIRRIPVELGRTAARTLYTFVFDFFRTNPNLYDGTALYAVGRGNLLTAAWSGAQYAAHRLAMMKMTGRDTGNRTGIGPKMVLGPMDLEEAMVDTFRRNTNNDKTFVQSLAPEIIPVATWTDANDWCTLADPLDVPVLEIGFLDGAEEPTLLLQDSPTEGQMFTNDMLSWKLRHIYGGNLLVDSFKGTTKAVVP